MATGKEWRENAEKLNILEKNMYLDALENLWNWDIWRKEMPWIYTVIYILQDAIKKEEQEFKRNQEKDVKE